MSGSPVPYAAKNGGTTEYEADDVITVTINGNTLAYTVVAADVDADDTGLNDNLIAAINADTAMGAEVTAVATDKDVMMVVMV